MFELLTMPVTLLLLGIPARMYAMLLVLPGLTAVGLSVKGLAVVFSDPNLTNSVIEEVNQSLWLGPYNVMTVLCAAIIVYCSSLISAFTYEKSRRTLFVLYCGLQTQQVVLSRDARFRRYRDVMAVNRSFFTAPSASTTKKTVVTSGRVTRNNKHRSHHGRHHHRNKNGRQRKDLKQQPLLRVDLEL